MEGDGEEMVGCGKPCKEVTGTKGGKERRGVAGELEDMVSNGEHRGGRGSMGTSRTKGGGKGGEAKGMLASEEGERRQS